MADSEAHIAEKIAQARNAAIEEAVEIAEQTFHQLLTCIYGPKLESPIERLMAAALIPFTIRDEAFHIVPQYKIDKYRVDFLIWYELAKGETIEIVVECDGHDFHERTKQQAERDKARDRYLTGKGYRVLRFTGSEIWRDPEECAYQVWDVCTEAMQQSVRRLA